MRVYINILLSILLTTSCQLECNDRIVKTETSKGLIMQSSSPSYSLPKEAKRFFPPKNHIVQLEKQLRLNISEINKEHPNQLNQKDYIENNLSKYNRQYFGFVNNKGAEVIFINFFKESINCEMNEELIVLDGCSEYWQIFYNVKTKTFEGFSVNGCA